MEDTMSMSIPNVYKVNALKPRGIKERIIFLKNEKYECQGSIVVCIKTTCSYSSTTFKAIYIGQTGQYSTGNGGIIFKGFFGEIQNCLCVNYKPYHEGILL